MDWDSPESRLALIESVGIDAYNRLHQDHIAQSTLATINGYRIRPVTTRWGRLYFVNGTPMAFRTVEEAISYASNQPTNRSALPNREA